MSDGALISRRSLHDEVAALLRDMIMEGNLRPGDRVAEQALCLRFGVSRTPLREALKVLAAEGLVVLSPNKGASVARITPEEIEELFPIMGALEALAGELACQRIDEAALVRVRAMHRDMLGHFERGERGPYAKLNRAIHDALFEAAGNRALTAMYHNLIARTHSARFVARKSPARWREAVDDHERMMEALEARDGSRLAAILREHLQHKAAMVREAEAELEQAAAG